MAREGAGKKKATPRKAATKRKPPRQAAHGVNRREQAKKDVKRDPAPAKAPSGRRLNAAAQNVRDSLMIARLAQDWPWEAIAAEAGISVQQAKKAVKARQEAAPLRLNMDPVAMVERVFEGLQLSVGDLESLASAATEKGNLAVAVGAKRSANDAREKIMGLLQSTGRLPQEMGALRHLIDLRAIAVRMLDAMDEFERDMLLVLELSNDAQRKAESRKAADKVRLTFAKLMGMDDEEKGPETVDASPAELPA